jgi:hypothetical protein
MSKRLPASMRTRQSLSDVIEGRLSSPAGREELVELATRLIIEETLEAEARDAVGRDYDEQGVFPIPDETDFLEGIGYLRRQGVSISIDDFRHRHSNLESKPAGGSPGGGRSVPQSMLNRLIGQR